MCLTRRPWSLNDLEVGGSPAVCGIPRLARVRRQRAVRPAGLLRRRRCPSGQSSHQRIDLPGRWRAHSRRGGPGSRRWRLHRLLNLPRNTTRASLTSATPNLSAVTENLRPSQIPQLPDPAPTRPFSPQERGSPLTWAVFSGSSLHEQPAHHGSPPRRVRRRGPERARSPPHRSHAAAGRVRAGPRAGAVRPHRATSRPDPARAAGGQLPPGGPSHRHRRCCLRRHPAPPPPR